jgi:hypothetical protein
MEPFISRFAGIFMMIRPSTVSPFDRGFNAGVNQPGDGFLPRCPYTRTSRPECIGHTWLKAVNKILQTPSLAIAL